MDHRAGLAGAITGSQPDPRPWLRAPDSRSRDRRGAADRLRAWRAREREPLAQGGPPSRRLQRVTLDLPLGSHLEPLPRDAEVSAPALADLIADALDALDLDAATVVGNDTGGALTQILATRRPERVGAFMLTSATPSTTSHRVSFASCSHRRASRAPCRSPSRPYDCVPARRLPIAYGWLSKKSIDRDAEDSYVLPVLTRREVRRGLRRVLSGLDASHTIDAALKLVTWERPAQMAWSQDDRFFSLEHGERLAKIIPGARFEMIEWAQDFLAGGPAGAAGRPDCHLYAADFAVAGVKEGLVSADTNGRHGPYCHSSERGDRGRPCGFAPWHGAPASPPRAPRGWRGGRR
jgi:pimeloyl-ACP methyl ester carboxylesterase